MRSACSEVAHPASRLVAPFLAQLSLSLRHMFISAAHLDLGRSPSASLHGPEVSPVIKIGIYGYILNSARFFFLLAPGGLAARIKGLINLACIPIRSSLTSRVLKLLPPHLRKVPDFMHPVLGGWCADKLDLHLPSPLGPIRNGDGAPICCKLPQQDAPEIPSRRSRVCKTLGLLQLRAACLVWKPSPPQDPPLQSTGPRMAEQPACHSTSPIASI